MSDRASELDFELHVNHNRYLAPGVRELGAVISVGASSGGRRGHAPAVAEVIMLDCSGSMEGEKIIEAKQATTTAIDLLRDEVLFAVIAGTRHARMVYPAGETMVPSSPVTREEAKKAVRDQQADGGTAIGTWLELADKLMVAQHADIKHGILLTDGHNLHQRHEDLLATLERCRGHFVCECRGVGKGWSADPLNATADALLGSADGLPNPKHLAGEFRAMIEAVMGKTAANVRLRVWHPRGGRIRMIEQVHPEVLPLTAAGVQVSELVTEFPTGSWGAEFRDYQITIELPAGKQVGDEVLGANVELIVDDNPVASGLVPAVWTADAALSTKVDPKVGHFTDQSELNTVTRSGMAALKAGRKEEATLKLGRAVQLAHESKHEETLRVLKRVVDVINPDTAQVRLRKDMAAVDQEMLGVKSRKTKPYPSSDGPVGSAE